MDQSKIRVLASITDFGVSSKHDRGIVAGQGEPPRSVAAMGSALHRFSQRMGVSLNGSAAEISARIRASLDRPVVQRDPTPRSSTPGLEF